MMLLAACSASVLPIACSVIEQAALLFGAIPAGASNSTPLLIDGVRISPHSRP